MLVRVYTCQNATLLEITCRGSLLFNHFTFLYLILGCVTSASSYKSP